MFGHPGQLPPRDESSRALAAGRNGAPSGDTPHPGKMLDMVMLIVPGGQERTAAEYGALLDKAGFQLTRVVPTASPVSIVEAIAR